MSTMDQPRGLWRGARTVQELRAATSESARSALAVCGQVVGQLRCNRALRVAAVSAIVAWIALELAFVAWVHLSMEGSSHRAFLPGTWFGVPDREAAAGMQCISKYGYDGQLYYWQSNDIFGRRDAYKHSDNVMYRYQRIGMPMLAGAVATLFGFPLTPPLLYHTLNFGIASIGFGALVYWLLINNLNPAYALGWLLAVGTIESLWKGLLDSSGDAVFALATLAIFSRRMWLYVPLASFLLLTREVYAVFAFSVFVATLTRRIDWQDAKRYWQQAALAALPGIVMLAWTAYLTIHFKLSPIEGHTNNPALTDYPFYMMLHYIQHFYLTMNWSELRLSLLPAFTIVLISILLVRNCRRLPWAILCVAPFVLMTDCLGKSVWEGYGASTRVTGTLLVTGLFMMPFDRTVLLPFLFVLQGIAGVAWESDIRFFHPPVHSPHLLHEETPPDPNPAGSPENGLLNDLRSSVVWLEPQTVCRRQYHGAWDAVHREIKAVKVAVTNNSGVTWYGGRGKNPIWIGCMVYDAKRQRLLAQHMKIIDLSIAPGQTEEFSAFIELGRPQTYQVEFSLFQAGPGWFSQTDPNFGGRYEVTVE